MPNPDLHFYEGSNGDIFSKVMGVPVVRVLPEHLTLSDAQAVSQVVIQALSLAFPPSTARAPVTPAAPEAAATREEEHGF